MNRKDIIQAIIDATHASTYLEIGVSSGEVFTSIKCQTKIGVDPITPSEAVAKVVGPGCMYFQMTSDEFFDSQAETQLEGGLDVAFIDGMHSYEHSYRDVLNCLKHMDDRGVIVMHDCNPPSERAAAPLAPASVEATLTSDYGPWTGDVWKTIVDLRARDDLSVFVLDCDLGVGVVSRGRPGQMLRLSKSISELAYDNLAPNRAEWLNLMYPEFIWKWLSDRKRRHDGFISHVMYEIYWRRKVRAARKGQCA